MILKNYIVTQGKIEYFIVINLFIARTVLSMLSFISLMYLVK